MSAWAGADGGVSRTQQPGSDPLGVVDQLRLAEGALELAGRDGVDGVEVVVHVAVQGLTRFAASQVHQNVWTTDVSARVRVVTDDARVGIVETSGDDPRSVAAAAGEARDLARLSPPTELWPGLQPAAHPPDVEVDDATIAASPGDRAQAVARLLAEVRDPLHASGTFATGGVSRGVFTSAGQQATARSSGASTTCVVTGPSSSGWAEDGARALSDVDPGDVGGRAARTARAAARPTPVEAGVWPVVLEPAAVGALVDFYALLAGNGKAWLEGRSPTSGRLGDRALDPRITIVDDATDRRTVGLPLDAEGAPRRQLTLVREGVLEAVAHDRATALRARTSSTGHALPAPNPHGPLPTNPLLLPGADGTVDDLVAGCERGLLVTRFHYVNVKQPRETVLTGMTRDGTFLVEDGRVRRPVTNLRFQQSIIEALAQVDAVSTETRATTELFDAWSATPALALPAFRFTSTTSF